MDGNFNIIQFLKSAVATGASDEHLKVGHPPFIRLNGFIKKTNLEPLTKEVLERAVLEIAPETIKDDISTKCDIDFMFEIKGSSRFRVNYSKQLGSPALVIRNIPYGIPTLDELGLPETLKEIIGHQNGIILNLL